jgi:hypothetical protein
LPVPTLVTKNAIVMLLRGILLRKRHVRPGKYGQNKRCESISGPIHPGKSFVRRVGMENLSQLLMDRAIKTPRFRCLHCGRISIVF